ncbi:glycosyltransferase family 2 protein [Diaphorobacter sp.]|uniref:glycosyltransferase family 2 protein n=1 Tax=Diaphorobacter sp. TaxID=1934310 RepID=UPI003D0DDC05
MSQPLLSLCIPTCNRAELLEPLLENIARESAPFLDRLEIVVSDNASTDHTEAVVKASRLPIIYGKNASNLGFGNNLLNVTAKLASGHYVWVISDDDIVLPGGIARIMDSISAAPHVSYHYVNFGWIGPSLRSRLIRQAKPAIPEFLLKNLQCDSREWLHLSQLEELVFLPGKNPSALFSGTFCFVTRRQFFVDALNWLKPSASVDGSSVLVDDCFPHAMLTVPRVAGQPIAYIGEPCMLQCVGAWEWKAYANKNMIFGIHQFFRWLEGQGFGAEGMQRLWSSYYDMAGRLFARMQCFPEENKGFDIVMHEAIPDAASRPAFWNAFMNESKLCIETDHEAEGLARLVREFVGTCPNARIGLWGIQGRGYSFLRKSPDLHANMVWVTDKEEVFHGDALEYADLKVSPPESISSAKIDCLVIATRRTFINDVIDTVSTTLAPGTTIISVDGLAYVEEKT